MILVMQSFGSQEEYKRAVFAILSYYAHTLHANATQTYLFTDNQDFFQTILTELPIRYFLLTPQKMKSMRGSLDFLHRMKIALIEEALSESGDVILYSDSDTFFISDPTPLIKQVNEGASFMHLCEYRLDFLMNMRLPAGAIFHRFVNHIRENIFSMPNGKQLNVTDKHFSWNAGVMMLHPAHKKLLSEIYLLTDNFYQATLNHACEQYAFSIVLQNNTKLRSCESVIYHYWYREKKKIMDAFLGSHITTEWAPLPISQKIEQVKTWSLKLPQRIKNSPVLLRDQAIQAFHENQFQMGYKFAFKALLRSPFDFGFSFELLYHTKRYLKTISNLK